MRDVNIDAQDIGNIVNSENAQIQELNTNIGQNTEKIIQELIHTINLQADRILTSKNASSPEQQALAKTIVENIAEIQDQEDPEEKRSKVESFVADISGIMGESYNLVTNVNSLLKLFG